MLVCACATGLLAGDGPAPPAPPSPRRVVFFFIDTLRADHCSCYGYRRPTTPSLDSLADRGTLFESAFSHANISVSSYSTIFTSLYVPSHGVYSVSESLPPQAETLAEVLHAHGFDTGAFASGGHLAPNFGLNQGFQTYWTTLSSSSFSDTVPRALHWMEAHRDRPSFVFLQGYDVHGPYCPPLGFGEMYDHDYEGLCHVPGFLSPNITEGLQDGSFDLQKLQSVQSSGMSQRGQSSRSRILVPPFSANVPDEPTQEIHFGLPKAPWRFTRDLSSSGLPVRVPNLRAALTRADVEHLIAHYDGAVSYADMWLGIFVERLHDLKMFDDTLIFVAGDHGECLGEHGFFRHGTLLYEPTIHVPLVVAGPGVAQGRRVTDVVSLVDLAPTVLELCKVPPSHQHQGKALGEYLRHDSGPPADPSRVAFSCITGSFSVRSATRHLLCEQLRQDSLGRQVLYDPRADPAETVDLSAREPLTLQRMVGQVLDFLERSNERKLNAQPSRMSDEQRSQMRMFGYW
ncbi:MAG: sulfatase [Candidatus Riflebacteria bacterium]|nr:sulfatase [Candidatus Riflebacteria bacterium]